MLLKDSYNVFLLAEKKKVIVKKRRTFSDLLVQETEYLYFAVDSRDTGLSCNEYLRALVIIITGLQRCRAGSPCRKGLRQKQFKKNPF